MSDIAFRQKLAELQTRLAIGKAQVLANPEPYLDDLTRRCTDLLKVLEDIDYALSPDCPVDWAQSHNPPIKPMNLQGEALIRCNAALKVIRDYRYPQS